jgi:outer membrane protein assembly factor BamC
MNPVNKAFASTPVRAAVLLLVLTMGGCSSVDSSGDKVDYRAGARKTQPLDVPPDLTALVRDGRYTPQAGSVSANALQQPSKGQAANDGRNVAPAKVGDVRLERQGNTRWLVTPQAAELVYPKVKQFWTDLGLNLVTDSPATGVIETDWAENRAKLPQDLIRSTIGKVFESLYSTGERDKYRTRIERSERGTEITISHRGLEEVVVGKDHDGSTTWTNRPNDPLLEAEMLSRLMLALGGSEDAAKAIVASASEPAAAAASTPVAKARLLAAQAGSGAGLIVDDGAERAWRRVGLALDRGGFTVEDRDRAQMLYFVRYADPKSAGHEEPGFFARLFSSKEAIAQLSRYRIAVKASGSQTVVNVLTADGAPDNSANAQRIATMLVEELKN